MYANISQDFLKTYSNSKQEELLKEVRERRLSQQVQAGQKAQERVNAAGRAIPAFKWLTFIKQHI